MQNILTEEERRRINEKSKELLEAYDPSKYQTFEEKIKACHGITLDEFREMGLKRIEEIYEKKNCNNS